MGRFVKGDVVVIPFPFSDLTGNKRRPALILVDLNGDDCIVCQITSKHRSDPRAISLASAVVQRFKRVEATVGTEAPYFMPVDIGPLGNVIVLPFAVRTNPRHIKLLCGFSPRFSFPAAFPGRLGGKERRTTFRRRPGALGPKRIQYLLFCAYNLHGFRLHLLQFLGFFSDITPGFLFSTPR
jgi:hypothetical protein